MTNFDRSRELATHEKLILQAIYDEGLQGRRVTWRQLLTRHNKEIPIGFDPKKMDPRLVDVARVVLQLEGLAMIEGWDITLAKSHKILYALKELVLSDDRLTEIDTQLLLDKVGMSRPELGMYLDPLWKYKFWGSHSYPEPHSTEISKLDIGSSESFFDEIYQYNSMEELFRRAEEKRREELQEDMTGFESDGMAMQSNREAAYDQLCAVLDELKEQYQGTLAQIQVLNKEIEEIKELYFKLNNKNFWQTVRGKLGDELLHKLFEKETIALLCRGVTTGIALLQNHS